MTSYTLHRLHTYFFEQFYLQIVLLFHELLQPVHLARLKSQFLSKLPELGVFNLHHLKFTQEDVQRPVKYLSTSFRSIFFLSIYFLYI